MGKIASRLDNIKPSLTLSITQKAQELRARGVDVISFSAGEPDFDTPAHIVKAAKDALDNGLTRYTPVAGMPDLRATIAAANQEIRGVNCAPNQVVVTVGAKHALYGFFQAVINNEEEVIIPAPYWVSYPDQVLLAGGKPVIVETSAKNNWMLTPDDLEKAVTSKTRALVLNTPSNPTGSIYDEDTLKALTQKALELNLWIISDEIYKDITYDGIKHISPVAFAGDKTDRVFIVDGVSKTFAMTGWRIGWGIGDAQVIAAISKIQGQSTSNPASMAQAATLAAITQPKDFLKDWCKKYAKRRDIMVSGLNEIPTVECLKPQGAFYVLPNMKAVIAKMGPKATDTKLSAYLLEEGKVATVPGTAFGAPGYIRLSYATSTEAIKEGLIRLKDAINKI